MLAISISSRSRRIVPQSSLSAPNLASTQPEIAFWLDGVEIPAFHREDYPTDDCDTVRFGFEKYGPELEIWFDDIAISAAPIGCR